MRTVTKKMMGIGTSIMIFSLLILACNKSSNSPASERQKALSVYLTDDPAPFSSVFIDIKIMTAILEIMMMTRMMIIPTMINMENGIHCLSGPVYIIL